MIKLKRTSESGCNVLIDFKLDNCELDLLDMLGFINEKEIKSTTYNADKTVVTDVTNETVLMTILNHQVNKKLSKMYSAVSRDLFLRFIYKNIQDCLVYHFGDILPDAVIIQKEYVIAREHDQGVKHLKQLFPELYSRYFDAENESSCYLGSLDTDDGKKGVILLQMKRSFMLNTFSILHEWKHHLYALGRKTKGHKIPNESYKQYRWHFGKSSWEEKRCDWYAIKTMCEYYGPGTVRQTLIKLNENADSRAREQPFVDNKYRVKLMCRLARRYLKVKVGLLGRINLDFIE